MLFHPSPSLSVPTWYLRSALFPKIFILKLDVIVHLDSMMDWLDLSRHRSKVIVTHIHGDSMCSTFSRIHHSHAAIWSSVSWPRTLWNIKWRTLGSNHRSSGQWMIHCTSSWRKSLHQTQTWTQGWNGYNAVVEGQGHCDLKKLDFGPNSKRIYANNDKGHLIPLIYIFYIW